LAVNIQKKIKAQCGIVVFATTGGFRIVTFDKNQRMNLLNDTYYLNRFGMINEKINIAMPTER
jgi:hypothetical protein